MASKLLNHLFNGKPIPFSSWDKKTQEALLLLKMPPRYGMSYLYSESLYAFWKRLLK